MWCYAGLEEGTWDWSGKTYKVPGVDLDFCRSRWSKFRLLCVGLPAVCEAHYEMRSMSLLGESGGMPPRKFLKKACSEIKSGTFWAQNCYAKDRLWKSATRKAHNSFFPVCRMQYLWKLVRVSYSIKICFNDQLAYTNNERLYLYWYHSEASHIMFHAPICLKYLLFSFYSKLVFGKLERLWWPKLKGNGGRRSSHCILLNIMWI